MIGPDADYTDHKGEWEETGKEKKNVDGNEIGTSGIHDPNAPAFELLSRATEPAQPKLGGEVATRPIKTILNRLDSASIRKVRDLKTEDVEIPEWGGFVTVKALTSRERDDFENSVLEKKKGGKSEFTNKNIRAKLVVRCVVNEKQERLFADEDASWLGDKNAHAVNKLYAVAAKLSGITDADADELEGNSESVDGGAS